MARYQSKIEIDEFRQKIRDEKRNLVQRCRHVAELVANEIVNYARDTGEYGTQPPAKAGEGKREAHPGGWADITGNLANSIQTRIEQDGITVRAIIEATMEYAEKLDAKTGYDVLGGAEKLARKAIRKHKDEIFGKAA